MSDSAIELLQQHKAKYEKALRHLENQLSGVHKAIDAHRSKIEAVDIAIQELQNQPPHHRD